MRTLFAYSAGAERTAMLTVPRTAALFLPLCTCSRRRSRHARFNDAQNQKLKDQV